MKALLRLACLALPALWTWALPAQALTLTDTEFDLTDYQVNLYAAPGQSLTVTQNPLAGNPGAALQLHALLPPPGFSNALGRVLAFSNVLAYDPAVAGPIGTLDWRFDKWMTVVQPAGLGVFNGVSLLIEQGGRYYINVAVLPSTMDTWHTGNASGLTAQSFAELTDPLNGVVNNLSHPDFGAGLMRFGLSAGFAAAAGSPTIETIGRYDNLVVSISPVPEPSTLAMGCAGAALLLLLRRRRWLAGTALLAPALAGAAVLSNQNIDVRTTTNEIRFGDLSFAGAFYDRQDVLDLTANVGDSGVFSFGTFTPGFTIAVGSGAGIAISNVLPADASGFVSYTATVVGLNDQTITQSWVTRASTSGNGPLTRGVAPNGLQFLEFFGRNSGFLRPGGVFDYSVSMPGDWSRQGTASGEVQFIGLNPTFTIVQAFVFDPATNTTTLQIRNSAYDYAQPLTNLHFILWGQPVPEATTVSMLLAGLAALALLAPRRMPNARS